MIRTTFSVTFEEYLEIQRAYINAQKGFRLMRWLVLLGTGLGLANIFYTSVRDRSFPPITAGLIFSVIVFTFMLFWFQILSGSFEKSFQKDHSHLEDVTVQIDEIGYHSTSATTEVKFPWGTVDSYLETPAMFTIIRARSFFGIPKRALSGGEQEELRAFLCANFPITGRKLRKL